MKKVIGLFILVVIILTFVFCFIFLHPFEATAKKDTTPLTPEQIEKNRADFKAKHPFLNPDLGIALPPREKELQGETRDNVMRKFALKSIELSFSPIYAGIDPSHNGWTPTIFVHESWNKLSKDEKIAFVKGKRQYWVNLLTEQGFDMRNGVVMVSVKHENSGRIVATCDYKHGVILND